MSRTAQQKFALLSLCMAAGMADVIGYLGLGHVLTANMTGNIVLLGIAIAHAQEIVVIRSLLALAGFIAGNAFAAKLIGPGQSGWSKRVTRVLIAESLLLLFFAIVMMTHFSMHWPGLVIVVLGAAMGMQTTAARKIGMAGISTTVLTNNLAAVVEDAANMFRRFGKVDRQAARNRLSGDDSLRVMAVAIYLTGVIIAAFLFHHVPKVAVWLPALLVGGVAIRARMGFGSDRRQPSGASGN
ncbi:YoaK family protein [Paenibacillus sp. JJ-223]|uniref:YoaK family protein n=1 Tax=Paenibacillus sp. JJ-223 TaxID=2905647 RepID=UPI001F36E0F1|nr:YoaK family protein [Paenibacillus sp. JJ-223]CAH1216361.1 hypothetical protein PAECIP111890_04406 [Paenibacillus sp. JJ-223]